MKDVKCERAQCPYSFFTEDTLHDSHKLVDRCGPYLVAVAKNRNRKANQGCLRGEIDAFPLLLRRGTVDIALAES